MRQITVSPAISRGDRGIPTTRASGLYIVRDVPGRLVLGSNPAERAGTIVRDSDTHMTFVLGDLSGTVRLIQFGVRVSTY